MENQPINQKGINILFWEQAGDEKPTFSVFKNENTPINNLEIYEFICKNPDGKIEIFSALPKKKYTIIYSDAFTTGSHINRLIRKVYVETADIAKLLNDKYPNVEFCFDGWTTDSIN